MARGVALLFDIKIADAASVIAAVRAAVGKWSDVAAEIGISRRARDGMAGAFDHGAA